MGRITILLCCILVAFAERRFSLPSRDRMVKNDKRHRGDDGTSRHMAGSFAVSTVPDKHAAAEDIRHHKAAPTGISFEQHLDIFEEYGTRNTRRTSSSSSKYSGLCCSNHAAFSASTLCGMYNQDCENGDNANVDDNQEQCYQDGSAFIGVSFSVHNKTGNGNSHQLCDQFPMENLIDRSYDYVMSTDEYGWLAGGGYKQFDTSGKISNADSAHAELLRIGSLDAGGDSMSQVAYNALSSLSFEPFLFYPFMVKTTAEKQVKSDDDDSSPIPSYELSLLVSIVEVYKDSTNDDGGGGSSYSTYETFKSNLQQYVEMNGGCVKDSNTDLFVTLARGIKFKSSYHMEQYLNRVNLEVAVWQAMYPKGVVIGSSSTSTITSSSYWKWKSVVGYGNLYYFLNRNNIIKSFPSSRSLSSEESYYSTFYTNGYATPFYSNVTNIDFKYGSNDDGNNDNGWEYSSDKWTKDLSLFDPTTGLNLPPNCYEDGEAFVGIALSRNSVSSLQSQKSFQSQFDFNVLVDHNSSYITGFDSDDGWLVGSNSFTDTANIPLFHLGSTNAKKGGLAIGNLYKVLDTINFASLYIKPAFVFIDDNGHLKLQFEADESSAVGYLYNSLCKTLGIKWNNRYPTNNKGLYTNCAMHAAGDRASLGCGLSGGGSGGDSAGGFCPQMYLAYYPKFISQESAAAYLNMANTYVDYWRNLYPSGVATGTSKFCSKSGGGCLGLFLNRQDLYDVFAPAANSNGRASSMGAPTISPAPNTYRSQSSRANIASMTLGALEEFGEMVLFALAFIAVLAAFASVVTGVQKKKEKKRAGLLLDDIDQGMSRGEHREIV